MEPFSALVREIDVQKIRVTRHYDAGFEDLRRGLQATECRLPPEAGQFKELDSPSEPPEWNIAQIHIDFIPVSPLPDF